MSKNKTLDDIIDDFFKEILPPGRSKVVTGYDEIGHKCLEFIKKYEKQRLYLALTARTESK